MNNFYQKPAIFNKQCDFAIWFQQFELFLKLAGVKDESHVDVLLSFLDLTIFEAVTSSISTSERSFDKVKDLLFRRYSSSDVFIDRLAFFSVSYSESPETYAGLLSSLMDKFDNEELRDQS